MTKTIKLIPTEFEKVGEYAEQILTVNDEELMLGGIDDNTFATASTVYGPTVSLVLTKFKTEDGKTEAEAIPAGSFIRDIHVKTKLRPTYGQYPSDGCQIKCSAWGSADYVNDPNDPTVYDIPYSGTSETPNDWWTDYILNSGINIELAFEMNGTGVSSPCTLLIYGAEIEVEYDSEPPKPVFKPNSSAEVTFGDTGSTKKYDLEIKDLKVEDGKLNGTALGIANKSYTGRQDRVTLELTDVPFDGVGGGSSIPEVTFTITEGSDDNVLCTCDTSYDELANIANTKQYCLAKYHFTAVNTVFIALSDVRISQDLVSHEDYVLIVGNVVSAEPGIASIMGILIIAKDDGTFNATINNNDLVVQDS